MQKSEKQITTPPVQDDKVKIRLLCNPTGMYNLANNYGDELTLSPELTKRLLDAGDAEIVKP